MKKSNEFMYGVVFKVEREQKMEDIQNSLKAMKEVGFDTVVVWPAVYWWEEKGPDYPYGTGKALLEYAGKIGISVIMELAGQITALEYAPDFLCKEDYYCVDRKGCKDLGTISYGYLNFNHPQVQALIEKQYTEVAEAYREYPALRGYDIWNETQFTSFDAYTLNCFRVWLKEKYRTLEQLNDAWDRVYDAWEQVQFTPWMWASVTATVDYQQFHKDNIGMILQYMCKAVEKADTQHLILADNIHATVAMDAYYDRPSDDWGVAKEVDRYGISFYPKFFSKHTPAVRRHQIMAGAHSAAKDGVFSISEMQTHHASMFNPDGSVSPKELWQWCWEAVSHGAKGLIYWKWDPFRKGVQTGGRGLVDHGGRETVRTKVARQIHQVLEEEPLFETAMPETETAAILYDRLNHDFTKAYTMGFRGTGIGAPDSIYLDSLAGLYQSLWRQNIPVKFVTPEQICGGEIQKTKVLFVTTQVTMNRELSQALLTYVENGGICVCDGKFGEVDGQGLLYRQIPGEGLSEALGFEMLDFEEGDLEFQINGAVVQGGHDRRQISLENSGAEAIGIYKDGRPAVIRADYGKGSFYYVSTFVWYACHCQGENGAGKLIELLEKRCNLKSVSVSAEDIFCQRLDDKKESLIFAFSYGTGEACGEFSVENHWGKEVSVRELLEGREVKPTCRDGRIYFSYEIPEGGTAIFKIMGNDRMEI